jgi:hypothetical protein
MNLVKNLVFYLPGSVRKTIYKTLVVQCHPLPDQPLSIFYDVRARKGWNARAFWFCALLQMPSADMMKTCR